jgi:hypothetical protein
MGDSLSTHYMGTRASAGDKSWVDLLRTFHGDQVAIEDLAANGATSSGVLNRQAPQVRQMVQSGSIHFTVLAIGGNDERAYLDQITSGNASPFISEVTSNIENTLKSVASGGHVQRVLSLLPDIGDTPAIKVKLGFNPIMLGRLTAAVRSANSELLSYASGHGIVVVDAFALGKLTSHPLVLGSIPTTDFWSPDNFHPSGIPQGLFPNMVMRAFQIGYGVDTQSLQLSDQDILAAAGDAAHPMNHAPSYYNVSPFVILPNKHVTPLVWASPATAHFYPNLDLLTSLNTGLPPIFSGIVADLLTSGVAQGTAVSPATAASVLSFLPHPGQLSGPHLTLLPSALIQENPRFTGVIHHPPQQGFDFHFAGSGLGQLAELL